MQLNYDEFAYDHNRIREPIDDISVYENRRQMHCNEGLSLSRKQHIKFGVIDEETETVLYQSIWLKESDTECVDDARTYVIGYRAGVLHGQGLLEKDQ